MKILVIIPYFYPALYYGGPVRVTYELTRRLVKRGHEVTVYTTDVFDNTRRYHKRTENIEGVRVHYFKNINNNLACRYHAFLPIGFYSALKNSCREYDLIHINEYYTLLAVAAAKLARKNKIPFIFSAHGSLPVIRERGNQGRKMLFNMVFSRMTFKGIYRAIALNEKEREQFHDMGVEDKRIEIIPNGIDVEEFKELPDGVEFRKRYGIGTDEKVILYVGRIHEIKGLDTLLKAIKEITRTIKKIKLVIVGPDDGYLNPLQKMVVKLDLKSNVVITGLLAGKEKIEAYAASDIFVLPSYDDIWGIVVNEAMACRLPVIITEKVGAAGEIVKNGINGIIVKERDPAALSNTIEKLCKNSMLGIEMGNKGKDIVFSMCDWSNIVQQLEQVYKNVVKTM